MTRAVRAIQALALVLAFAAPAAADDTVTIGLEPWSAFDGEDRPYRYIVTVRATEATELVADRRLLSFELRVEGSRRRHRCRHPRAPRRPSDERIRTLAAGDTWREWIDLRMYCWGRALTALEGGAEVTPRYGFRRRSRRQWVARAPESEWRSWTGGLEPEPFTFPGTGGDGESSSGDGEGEGEDEIPLRVEVGSSSVRSGASVRFRASLHATEGSVRVFLRPTDFHFSVRPPEGGSIECELVGSRGTPAPDLYRRLSGRRAWRELLDASQFCPDETFDAPGVYEITPHVRLIHDGADYELDAPTGDLSGAPTPLRVTSGAYEEQVPERPDE